MQSRIWGIVGSRHYTNYDAFCTHLDTVMKTHGIPDKVVSGGAKGADAMAIRWAISHGMAWQEHKPDLKKYPNFATAAKARNTLIVNDADLVVAFVADDSKGTYDSINKSRAKKIPCVVIDI